MYVGISHYNKIQPNILQLPMLYDKIFDNTFFYNTDMIYY